MVGEIKHCGNLNEFLLKRLLYRHSNMGDSSDSDAEEDSKLREALDSETQGSLKVPSVRLLYYRDCLSWIHYQEPL